MARARCWFGCLMWSGLGSIDIGEGLITPAGSALGTSGKERLTPCNVLASRVSMKAGLQLRFNLKDDNGTAHDKSDFISL